MKRKSITWGLILTLSGIALFANIFGWFPRDVDAFWMIITIALVALSLSAIPRLDFFGIVMPLGFALIFNQELVGLNEQGWSIFWASLILSIGLSTIFRKRRKPKIYYSKDYYSGHSREEDDRIIDIDINLDDEKKGSHHEYGGDEDVSINNNFGDRSSYGHSSNLKRAELENNFCHLRVYFDQVTFSDGCVINVSNNLGKLTLYLPKTCRYRSDVETTMGAVEDSERFNLESETYVYIKGEVNMGALEIIYI